MAYGIKAEVVDPRAGTIAFASRGTMHGGKRIAVGFVALAISVLAAGSAAAADIRVLALQSPQIVMAEIGADFERKTGHTLTQLLRRTDMPPEATRKLDSGASFDVAFVLPPMMDLLVSQGRIVADTRTHFLRIGIGVTAIPTLLATPGVDVAGPLPQDIQSYVYFEGGVATNASAPDAARALLKFLAEGSTVRVIKSKGMEPW